MRVTCHSDRFLACKAAKGARHEPHPLFGVGIEPSRIAVALPAYLETRGSVNTLVNPPGMGAGFKLRHYPADKGIDTPSY